MWYIIRFPYILILVVHTLCIICDFYHVTFLFIITSKLFLFNNVLTTELVIELQT